MIASPRHRQRGFGRSQIYAALGLGPRLLHYRHHHEQVRALAAAGNGSKALSHAAPPCTATAATPTCTATWAGRIT